jgi:hypothetical protein
MPKRRMSDPLGLLGRSALGPALSAGASLPATSLIFVCFFRRDSTQKSPQKIGARYNAPLSSPDQD